MSNLKTQISNNFLGLSEKFSTYDNSEVFVLPIPYEATVTYGKGTSCGPSAILKASQQVEFYDREFNCDPALDFGIHTLPPLTIQKTPEKNVDFISKNVSKKFKNKKLFVGIGGEHSITLGIVKGIDKIFKQPITIVQIDAHCDLRTEYDGTIYNHACVSRRLSEIKNVQKILQLGVRSISKEEAEFIEENPKKIRTWFSENVHSNSWQENFKKEIFGKNVYLTIDVDGLDPGIIPATGTPEPDGLSWNQTLEIVRLTSECSNVIGFDCVELAPIPNQHASDFATAKLVYKTISLIKNSNPATKC